MNCSTFWAAAVTFTEEAAERTRSSFALHWKASQSARAFADNPKALPRTFGSLGKFYFFFSFPLQHLHAHSSIRNNKCPKATSHYLFAPSFQPSWLQDSIGYTEKGNHWVTLMPAKGKLSLGLVIESLHTWSQESSPQNSYSENKTRESESAWMIVTTLITSHHRAQK